MPGEQRGEVADRLEVAQAPRVERRLQDLVVITGYSGAGKSTAMNVFEDAGYFCIDNLPPEMVQKLLELFLHEGSKVERAAIVSDARGGEYFDAIQGVLEELVARGVRHRVLFLDADERTLLNRFKETRRRHPLAHGGDLLAGIAAERALLDPVRLRADFVFDTSGVSTAMLRSRIVAEILRGQPVTQLALTLMSFGFKHGPPRDEDLAVDVRFLPNPHYDPELRPLTGRNQAVVDYIARNGLLDQFYERLDPLLDFLLPQYIAEGKAHLLLAVGCTGGRHRSVAIVERLAERYAGRDDVSVHVLHRDIDKGAQAGAPDFD